MFSFLKFLNSKSDADNNKAANSLSGKTLNLNSAEAKALNIFNNRSPIARKPNGSNSFSRTDCKDTVTSPGFSFRIAQRAREVRPTTPNTDESSLSTSYILENSLNGSNMVNGNNKTRDIYDKKRKLMETLDNFGIRKRTRQEVSVDSFVNRRRRTISESNAPDRFPVMNGQNQRLNQPSSKCVNIDNKKTKRQGDFGTNMCITPKKPKTRNNEILSSYSSSKYLLKPGQKRPYTNDHEDESPKRKHCKSCTCCGSTVILESDQNNLNKRDKTTETDVSDDLVTVAASRIFNRSGKTQVVKKINMKTILDEVFDDIDHLPYTSIEKLQEKKKKAQEKVSSTEQHTNKSNVLNSNKPIDSIPSVSLTPTFNGIQPAVTSISSTASSAVSNASLIATPLVPPITSPTLGLLPSESTPKANEEKNSTSLQFSFGGPITSTTPTTEVNLKQSNEVDKKVITNQIPESNNITLLKTPTSQVPNVEHHKILFQSSEKNENINNEKSQVGDKNNDNGDQNNVSIQFTAPASKPNEPVVQFGSQKEAAPLQSQMENSSKPVFSFGVPKTDEKLSTPVMQFGIPKTDNKQSTTPVLQFGSPKVDDKQSTPVLQFGVSKVDGKQSTPVMQFGAPKVDGKQSTPVMQFGAPKIDGKQSTPVMQFGAPKVDEKQSTPAMQFGVPKVDEKQSTPVMQFGITKTDNQQSTPVMQFGAPKVDEKQSTPVMQFGAPKVDEKQSTPVMQFGATKTDNQQSTPVMQFGVTKASDNPISTQALFSFGNNQKSPENSKPTEPVKFQFGSVKSDNAPMSELKSNVVFGSNTLQNQNLFSFGKTENKTLVSGDPPKYDAPTDISTPKLQFAPVFGTSSADPSKAVFGSQMTENKVPTSASGMNFANNATNSMFQFNSSNSKISDKPPVVSNSSFQFSSAKTAPSFGDKPAFQFNAQKTETKDQFCSSTFGSQNTSTAPFKFGGNDKPAPFGSTASTFPSNQPLQFANNTEKSEPFKFGSTATPTNAFQFSTNKTDNGPVKFGQTSNTFSTPGFGNFGSSTSQQTTFGSVPQPQSSPFGNMTSTAASPTFGNVASPPSNTFGTNQSFQFGSTNNNPSNTSTFAFGANPQSTKPEGAFNFNASSSTTTSPFQFGQAAPAMSTPQFGGTQTQAPFGFTSPQMTSTVMPGSSQPLFSMGAPPAGERRKAKAVRRRQ